MQCICAKGFALIKSASLLCFLQTNVCVETATCWMKSQGGVHFAVTTRPAELLESVALTIDRGN